MWLVYVALFLFGMLIGLVIGINRVIQHINKYPEKYVMLIPNLKQKGE